jgi:hypothetical protein
VSSRTSVTMPIHEYQRVTTGLPPGGALMLCVASFVGGLVVGMTTLEDERAPTPRPEHTVQPSVPPQRTAPPAAR